MPKKSSSVKKWLNLTEWEIDPWVKPIYTAITQWNNSNFREVTDKISDLGFNLTIRLNMLPFILNRIESEAQGIYKTVLSFINNHDYINTENNSEGFSIPTDDVIKYNLLIDINSLLFELKSANELMQKFFIEIYNYAGHDLDEDGFIKKVNELLKCEGKNSKWFADLASHRNFFIHEGSPTISIDITKTKPEILIIKKHMKSFKNSSQFFRFSDLGNIIQGFHESKFIFQKHLCGLFQNNYVMKHKNPFFRIYSFLIKYIFGNIR